MGIKTLRVTKDEWAFFGTLLPYILMSVGAGLLLLLAVITRIGMRLQSADVTVAADTATTLSWLIVIGGIALSIVAAYLYSSRRAHYMVLHVILTIVLSHGWLIMALWSDLGDWTFSSTTFYTFLYGSCFVGLTWCVRRWAMDNQHDPDDDEPSPMPVSDNPFKQIGLGDAEIVDVEPAPGGTSYSLKLPYGKLVENAKDAKAHLAHIAGVARDRLHVTKPKTGEEGFADILILDENPFDEGNKVVWNEPQSPGESITLPITYATYDTGQRPELFLAGKNGGSSQHFLTMGMSGTGKSKAWQALYGTILSRSDVSVIYGDPAKGMQTGGPLASKLAWFATSYDECIQQIAAVTRAIPARTDYLTAKGYDHWEQGCGLNFVIFHLEEAARFAEVDDLVELIEAARSAGICIIISLQRATGNRLNTSARYNLGANMCFGVKMKRDATFGLSEFAIESGAVPHVWQDRHPGRHYLEASGVDSSMAGHPLTTDWVDIATLEAAVDSYPYVELDETTSDALGVPYLKYRQAVSDKATNWQVLRTNRSSAQSKRSYGFNTPQEETQAHRQHLVDIIEKFRQESRMSFVPADIKAAGHPKDSSWISKNLARLRREGILDYDATLKVYIIV